MRLRLLKYFIRRRVILHTLGEAPVALVMVNVEVVMSTFLIDF